MGCCSSKNTENQEFRDSPSNRLNGKELYVDTKFFNSDAPIKTPVKKRIRANNGYDSCEDDNENMYKHEDAPTEVRVSILSKGECILSSKMQEIKLVYNDKSQRLVTEENVQYEIENAYKSQPNETKGPIKYGKPASNKENKYDINNGSTRDGKSAYGNKQTGQFLLVKEKEYGAPAISKKRDLDVNENMNLPNYGMPFEVYKSSTTIHKLNTLKDIDNIFPQIIEPKTGTNDIKNNRNLPHLDMDVVPTGQNGCLSSVTNNELRQKKIDIIRKLELLSNTDDESQSSNSLSIMSNSEIPQHTLTLVNLDPGSINEHEYMFRKENLKSPFAVAENSHNLSKPQYSLEQTQKSALNENANFTDGI